MLGPDQGIRGILRRRGNDQHHLALGLQALDDLAHAPGIEAATGTPGRAGGNHREVGSADDTENVRHRAVPVEAVAATHEVRQAGVVGQPEQVSHIGPVWVRIHDNDAEVRRRERGTEVGGDHPARPTVPGADDHDAPDRTVAGEVGDLIGQPAHLAGRGGTGC